MITVGSSIEQHLPTFMLSANYNTQSKYILDKSSLQTTSLLIRILHLIPFGHFHRSLVPHLSHMINRRQCTRIAADIESRIENQSSRAGPEIRCTLHALVVRAAILSVYSIVAYGIRAAWISWVTVIVRGGGGLHHHRPLRPQSRPDTICQH